VHFSEIIKTIKKRRETLQVTQEGLAELSDFRLIKRKQGGLTGAAPKIFSFLTLFGRTIFI
jgi:predicted transcriptional regulator